MGRQYKKVDLVCQYNLIINLKYSCFNPLLLRKYYTFYSRGLMDYQVVTRLEFNRFNRCNSDFFSSSENILS